MSRSGSDLYAHPAYLGCVLAWLALWAYWLVSMRSQKAEKTVEPPLERARQIVPMVLVYTLLFSPAAAVWVLGRRILPAGPSIDALGLALTIAGVAFAIWARHHLGTNWSAKVSIRADHELVGTGPYRRIRHPIYTGMMLAIIGTAVVVGEVRGVVAIAINVTAFYLKARKEEAWLGREFGASFAEHQRRTGMFLPKI